MWLNRMTPRHTAQMYATTQCPEKQRRPSEARTLCHHNSKAKLQATTWECVHHPTSEADDPPTKGTPHNRGLSHSGEATGGHITHAVFKLRLFDRYCIFAAKCPVASRKVMTRRVIHGKQRQFTSQEKWGPSNWKQISCCVRTHPRKIQTALCATVRLLGQTTCGESLYAKVRQAGRSRPECVLHNESHPEAKQYGANPVARGGPRAWWRAALCQSRHHPVLRTRSRTVPVQW